MTTPAALATESNELVLVAVEILFGAFCYARTATFRRRFGRSPWGVHPNLWLAIGFILGPIGACMALLACVASIGPAYGGGQAEGTGHRAGHRTDQAPPAGWYPDPAGRHEYRFFTGVDWTSDVVDNGARSSEPLPAPPLG
ncbi:MAG: DUF2510 domain-containing protein [Acidimicrobiales bacterium]